VVEARGWLLINTTCWPTEPTAITVPPDPTVAESIIDAPEALTSDFVDRHVAPVPVLA
jgi:hypothetical protein